MIENADIEKVFEDTLDHKYDENGPFCFFKFLPWSEAHQEYTKRITLDDTSQSDCTYVSHMIMGVHHGISDGFTNIRIIRRLLMLLDDHFHERPIDETEQICSIIEDSEKEILVSEVEKGFLEDEKHLQERMKIYSKMNVHTLIEKMFPVAAGLPEKTSNIVHVVDKATTLKFKAKCKAEGVSFHAGFCSVLNGAIIKLVSPYCEGGTSHAIPSFHAMNLRYYYEKNKEAFGCGMAPFGTIFETPLNIMDDFWTTARAYNSELRSAVKSKACFEFESIQKLTGKSFYPNLNDHLTGSPLPPLRYYVTTNMLDVTPLVGHVGTDVKLQFYDRISSMHKLPQLWMSTYQTFRDQLIHSLQYNHQFMGEEAAQKLSNTIFEVLVEVLN